MIQILGGGNESGRAKLARQARQVAHSRQPSAPCDYLRIEDWSRVSCWMYIPEIPDE